MGIADDIINGKYQSGTSAYKKKKKKDESIADQIINGTYQDGLAAPIGIETGFSDDIAPVKKQEEDDSFWDKVGYVGKSFGTGIWGGVTGLFEAGTTETANNLDKGKEESFLGQLGDLFNATQYILNPTKALTDMAVDSTKESINILRDKDKNALEKATSIVNNATTSSMNLIPGKALADETMQTVGYFAPENASDMVMDFSNKATKPYYDVQQDLYEEGQQYGGGTQFLGETANVVGRMIPSIATSLLTKNPQLGMGVMATSVKGSSTTEALKKGAELDEAVKIGNTKAMIEYGTEMLFGGVNIFGKGALDDIIAKGIDRKVKNEVMNYLIQKGIGIGGEVVEETITDILNTAVDKGTVDPNASYSFKDWKDTAAVTVLSTAVINALTGGYGSASFKDNAARMKQNQAEGIQQEIAKKTEELNNSQDAREKQIIQGTINGLNEELNEITNAQQITDEKELRKQNFTYEAQETDSDIRKAVYESASQVMNNTETTHKFVDVVAKIAEEKGTIYKFTNNEQLKQLGYTKEGMTVNGLVNENGEVLINIDSAKALNTVVGHETTHLLEGTKEYEALKQVAIEYSKTKGDYNARIEKLTKLYEGTNADIEAELTSDIVGEYLFTDENFVKELSIKQPTVFEKIRNFISDLVVRFKGTDQEKQLRQLQRTFEKAYKAQGTQTTGTKYSVSEDTEWIKQQDWFKQLPKQQQEYQLKLIDTQNRTKAAKELQKEAKNYGINIKTNNDGTITLYHGTSQQNIANINKNGFNEQSYFSHSKQRTGYDDSAPEYYAKQKNKDGEVIKIKVDPRDIEFVSGTGEFYAPTKLYNNNGVWSSTKSESKQSTTDNQGRTLTKEQQEYFKDSKVRDEKGNLLEVYHGTNTDFTVFKQGDGALGEGIYFAESEEYARSWGRNNKLIKAYVNVTNPYISHGPSSKTQAQLIEQGYDGVYNPENGFWVAFNSNQIKNVDNTNPTTNPDIRYSLSEDGKMVDNKGNEVKLEAAEAGTHGTLMVIHNLSDFKLKGILELGGFPVPSIAITDPKKVDFTDYGDVSVLFDKETINPTNKLNEVYASDVYSPRFPDTVNELNSKGVKQVSSLLGMSPYEFESNYEDMSIDDVVQRLLRDENIVDKYLESKNIVVEPIYKTYTAEQSRVATKYVENFFNTHKELQDSDINVRELDYDNYSDEIKQIYIDSFVGQGASIEDAQDLYNDFGKADITKFLIDVKNFKKTIGQGQQIDEYATKQAKRNKIDLYSDEYQNFVKDLISPAFGDKYIRNNKEIFTPSGNRRSFKQLHDPYNLENVVKNMKGKVRGEEGFFYGAGNIRSQITPQFKSIADIKARENKLVTETQMEEVKQDINSDLNNLSVTARNFGGYDYDSYATALNEIAGLKRITPEKVRTILSEYGFKDVPDILVNKSIEFLEKLKNAPTAYFEAKPQRAVGFDEVEAIIIRNDMSAELKQQLYDKGLNVVEYDPNIEGDRQAKINEFDDLKFSLSAQNEEIAPTGQWNVRGEDVKLQVEEAIAPLQEKIESLTEQLETVVNSNKQPTMAEEITNLMNIKETQSGSDYARAFFDLRDKYGQPKLYKALNEYYATGTVTEPNEFDNLAPTSQDIIEKQGQENFEHLPDDLMPPEIDETEFAPDEDTYEDVSSPVQERDIQEVGNRKVKAYQYEHPEVRPYFQVEADNMLGELSRRIEGERYPITGEDGYTVEWTGITRSIPEDIAYLKDNYGYSYEQIEKGLKAIIEDNGAENNAVSKRLEILIDERLTNGYVDFLEGYPIPPNQEYKNLLIENDAADYYSNLAKTLDDADIAPEQVTMNTEPKIKANEQVIPQQVKMAQNGNIEATEGKQRKWVGTSTESEVVNREILPDDLDQSKIFYQPITNKETLGTANARLSSLGYEKSVEYFNNQFLSKKTTVEDIVLGERLIQEAIKKGDTKTAGDIIQNVAILGTELGQKVQALSIIQRMTPEGQLKMLEKTINRGKVKGDKAFTDIELTQEMKDKILKTYNKDGSYNQKALDKAIEDVKQEIADKMQVTAMDKINAWRYLSMLGNPKTHIRNLVSNVAMQGTLKVKNAVARTIEDIAPIKNKTKTWKAASDEVTNFARQTALEMKDVISGDSKYSESTDIKAKRQIFKNKVIEKLANLNSDMLEKEDWWFSKGAFESSFREFLTANGISTQADIQNNPELIEKGKNYAVEQAQIATFRQYSWLANKIRDIESKNAATQIAVGSVLPFKKTPINIAKTGLNYSPLGFAKTLTYDISQVKKGNMEASTLVDHIAQNTTGSALTLVGYMLAQAGFLNGAGDDDKEGKYDYQLGKQAYSISIGGNTYSLSWLSPVAMPLFVGTNMYEQLVEGEEWNADVVIETLGQTLDPLSEMSFLSSLTDTLSSYESGGIQKVWGMLEAAGKNYTTQFIPTASSQLAATLDDTKRTTKVSGDSTFKLGEELYNQIIYKIPFLRETLEPTTDIWGNEVKQNENLFTRAFENFIAPYSRKESIATEIDNELKDLYSQTGDNGLLPSIPYNYVNYDGEKYNMSAEEYTDYKKAYGQTANDLLEDLFRTTTYQNATSEERADMVNDVYDYARDEAKLDYLGKEGVDYTNATKEGEEYYKVNDIKGAIDNDMTVDEYRLYSEKPEKYNFFKNNGITYSDYEGNKDLYNYAYEHQDKYAASKAITGDFETYYSHIETMGDFDAKDEYGNSVNGLKKERVFNYVNSLDLDEIQKAIMFKMQYPKDDDYVGNGYNNAIVQYVGGLDMTYEEMVQVIEGLGMTVDDEGNVYWE